MKSFGVGAVLGLVAGAALGYGVATKAPDRWLQGRADSLATVIAAADSIRESRADTSRIVTGERVSRTVTRIARLDAVGDTLAATMDSVASVAPDTCLPLIEAVQAAFATYQERTRATLDSIRADVDSLVADLAYWRDTVVVDLRGEREAAMQLARDAIRARDRRVLRVAAIVGLLAYVAGKGL